MSLIHELKSAPHRKSASSHRHVFFADMVSPTFIFHILLVSSSRGHEHEISKAWCQGGADSEDSHLSTIGRYDLDRNHDALVVVDLLDRIRIRAGVFFIRF